MTTNGCINKPRKHDEFEPMVMSFERGKFTQKEAAHAINKEASEKYGWDSSTASHNYVANFEKSRRKKFISKDCPNQIRNMNAKQRLQRKLEALRAAKNQL
jgi:hypothetical protein